MPADARFGVRFDELAFTDDLAHATPAARQVAQAARTRLEHDGANSAAFKRCDPDARDGTSLPNCLKIYLPGPDGRWRMVFEILRDKATGELVLSYLAFGVAHPEHPWQPSVYQSLTGVYTPPPTSRTPEPSSAAGVTLPVMPAHARRRRRGQHGVHLGRCGTR